jgi:starch phosphorylase
VGEENIFIFGHTVEQIENLRHSGYRPRDYYDNNPEVKRAIDMIASGFFSPGDPERYRPLVEGLLEQDQYMLLADYSAYIAAQERVDRLYLEPDEWLRRAILNVSQLGHFSSDRTIRQYASEIWDIKPMQHKHPT